MKLLHKLEIRSLELESKRDEYRSFEAVLSARKEKQGKDYADVIDEILFKRRVLCKNKTVLKLLR